MKLGIDGVLWLVASAQTIKKVKMEPNELQEVPNYKQLEALQAKIDLKNTNIADVATYRNQLREKLRTNPEQFYIDFLVDIRVMIDNARASDLVKPREILIMESTFLEAWKELAKLKFVSADTKAKLLKDKSPKADPDKVKEIYG